MKMKKLSIMLVCVMLIGLLGGCGSSFDAAGYISAILDNSYRNDSSKFVSMKIGTAEEAAETYETTLANEVDSLIQLSDATNPTDEQYEQLKSIVEDIYGKAKYTVGEAEKQDDGSFAVTVTCEQIQVFGPAMEAYIAGLEEKANEYVAAGEMPSDDELNTLMLETYISSFSDAAANVTYADPATVTVRVELKDNLWQPNENDVLSLETSLFDIEALIEVMQQLN